MSETIQEMENRWAALMAARYGKDHPRSGERITDVDAKYARDVFVLGVQIDGLKKAAQAQPQINQAQLDWLNQAQGATDKNGRRLYQPGTVFQKNVDDARKLVLEGGDISGMRVSTEGAKLGPAFAPPTERQRQVASEEKTGGFGPPSHVRALPQGQPTNTNLGGA
jgi:hypothetical protein